MRYNLEIFKEYEKFDTKLDDKIILIINNLAQLVGAPTYQKTPNFKEKNSKKTKANWELLRNFKVTKIEKKIDGVEKEMNILREFLNKITENTYNENSEKILLKIRNFKNDKKNLIIICKYIFEMASTNQFYSEIYAKLYKKLINEFDEMLDECVKNLQIFFDGFEEIIYINSDDDYDKFCDMNELNDKRKAMSYFFMNLMKKDVIDIETILNFIILLHEKIFNLLKQENKHYIIEEYVENIFIFLNNNDSFFENNEKWIKIYKDIEQILNFKKSEYPSLTNKIKFKYLDIKE